MARSVWKFKFFSKSIWKNMFLTKFKTIKIIKLFCRNSCIPKNFFKKQLYIYKGNIFNKVLFNRYQLFFKFGEFSFTRKPFSFPQKKKKSKR